ncbi:uncharacterized protein EI97DRAFT_262528 [Westerdykella ornata]|uniref:Uncharacterized protein n=1 Tax=Westerdykella ornata TaxID=318751 RepID=A0A6A6J4Y7_WESOR|nr:uncharacterized protein EI97DRAFT_262528 [Westerdykella ornata]KAF2271641.1 hypothetical protein EI97DRAFT_262528 [Westerdykella ornata]
MARLLAALLLAATASAELTTSIRLPFGGDATTEEAYLGSVVGVDGDKTTMVIEYNDTEMTDAVPKQTMTLHGTTSVEIVMNSLGNIQDATYSLGCDMKDKVTASCVLSQWGDGLVKEYCGSVTMLTQPAPTNTEITTTYKTTVTENGKVLTETVTETFYFGDEDLSFCTPGVSELPKELSYREQKEKIGDVKFIITAGEEKLSATAGAKPTDSAAPSTTGSGFKTTTTPTGSAALSGSGTAAGSKPTGAASHMGAAGPVMALGVAAAALLL